MALKTVSQQLLKNVKASTSPLLQMESDDLRLAPVLALPEVVRRVLPFLRVTILSRVTAQGDYRVLFQGWDSPLKAASADSEPVTDAGSIDGQLFGLNSP
jgi:hypothetical protein